ncbi:TonB-dependent receptor domain-containing protein [Caulobacter segnis]
MSRYNNGLVRRAGLLVSVSSVVLASGGYAMAQDKTAADESQVVEAVTVTGSRITAIATNAPTPVTAVSTEQLTQTTPSALPDGLNKLPVFQGSSIPTRSGDGAGNQAQNVLALRGFGAQRTLVLIDGHRQTPSNANGTVDVDSVPQMLISRVDVVTGGASAVYGSDAVTGVVNFILDKKFTGLKIEANAGISTYGDGQSYKFGIAGGAKVLGGRGHVIGSYQRRETDDVDNFDRAYGRGVYTLTGSGTAAAPFTTSANVRRGDSAFGGKITACTNSCSALNQQFISNGVLGPFLAGQTTGTGNQNVGGDGAYARYTTALVAMRQDELFGRFDFDLTDNVQFYAQASYANAYSGGWHFPVKLTPGNGQASTFYKNNPFLNAATRAALGDNGASDATNTFQMGTYIISTGPKGLTGTRNVNEYTNFNTGLSGTLGQYRWDLFFTHGRNDLMVESRNNSNYQKQFAALDAVTVGGAVQCYAATQAATAAAYKGCVPLNAFGPTAISQDAFDWFTDNTHQNVINTMDNVGGSFTGTAFDNWAGPINFAVSAEARWNKYTVWSDASPTATVDCTGLRICNAALPLWAQPVSANVSAKNNVWEVAGELAIPLLKDLPLVSSLDANLAGRYTDYSTSGSVQTWKVGLDYRVNNSLRFRATTSRDIRAPTLNDLFQPIQASVSGFVDLHTSTSATVFISTQGNANLVPEVARTYTVGAVFTPSFLPGFNASVDWYKINMDNAIGSIAAGNTSIQQLCEASGGSSPYCALFERPLPFSNTTPANFPTKVYNQSLNTAYTEIKGFDFEANYRFEALGGSWSARLFANHQPTNISQAFPNAQFSKVSAPKTRVTTFLRYERGDLAIGVQDRWLSGFSKITNIPRTAAEKQYWVDPDVRAFNSADVNVEYKFGGTTTAYVTIQNVGNAKPEIVPLAGSIGLTFPVPAGQDIMGRYYTVGVRARF